MGAAAAWPGGVSVSIPSSVVMSSCAVRRSSSACDDDSGTPAASPSTMATTSLPDHATSTRTVRRLVVTRTSPRKTAAGGPSNRTARTRWLESRVADEHHGRARLAVEVQHIGRAWRDESVIERQGGSAHRRMAGKRAAAGAGEEQQAGIGVFAFGLGEDHADKAGVAAGLARQQQAHVVCHGVSG